MKNECQTIWFITPKSHLTIFKYYFISVFYNIVDLGKA